MNDLISRQAAIDALKNERSDWNCDYNVPVDHCIDAIYSLPPAQPEPSQVARDIATIIENEKDMRVILDNTEPCTDTISRQAAIDAIRAMQTYKLFEGDDLILVDQAEAQTELMMMTSAQQERKNEPVGCNGCRYDWFGDPRCAKCARSFQDHYEAERKEE